MPPESEFFRKRVLPEQTGMRLDQCAAALADGISRTRIQRAIASGNMTLNGVVCTVPRTVVAEGDELVFEIPEEPAPEHVTPEQIPLNILYEDEALMVIDKPAGMVVHPAAGNCSTRIRRDVCWWRRAPGRWTGSAGCSRNGK